MLKLCKLSVLTLLGTLLATSALADGNTLASVNGVTIPQARSDLMVKMAEAQGQNDSADLRKAIREELINLELLVQEAKKADLDKNPDVVQQMDRAQLTVLGGAFLQKYAQEHPIGDEQLSKEYDRIKASPTRSEYQVRHILVETEAEAKSIITQLGKKADFAKLAMEKSKDFGSAEKGGSLGWAIPNNFVPPFANAMLSLKKDEYTKVPVQSQFGWHVIRLDDVRDLKIPAFEDIKQQILQRLQQQMLQDLFTELRSKAKIE